ncbi:hypothetical protein V6N12_046277 [Hibiscus sabdariffa]|uniref:Uncharacterized protein n=1 Tax=Hibiscus sabdariffa TaxID=183260 RepID=A0ABR1ZHT1_9ROSI
MERAVDKEEVDGSSPTDSDIARMQILTTNARKAIAMGKNLGITFIGEEEDIVADFVQVKKRELQQNSFRD